LDAILVNASGCGTMLKDYGYMLKDELNWANRAKNISDLTCDISEFLFEIDLKVDGKFNPPKIAYHSACSLQHGQKIHDKPLALLKSAGFEVRVPKESHLCCGSAGTYSLLQPNLAEQLRSRKVKHLEATEARLIATGNIGCIAFISQGLNSKSSMSIVHTTELLDWATGGPQPRY